MHSLKQDSYRFKRNVDIGSLAAEDDKFLISAFVNKNELEILKNMNEPKSILLGRTGSGKSALIQYLEKNEEYIIRIDPESISLRHLSNSSIINYFKKLDIKLDLFYKVLWKHVFIVELIKLHFNNDINKSKNPLNWLKGKFPNQNKKKSIEYLEKWEDKFWEDTEYRIRELETSLEKRFKDEFGGSLGLEEIIELSAKNETEETSSQKIKYDVIHKAQKVVNESQIEHIKNILDIIKAEFFGKTQKKYFIVIDDLDIEWVSNSIVYDLIKSLIETIKDLSKIKNVKIVIALRSNIHKKIFKINTSKRIQREKYNHLYIDLQWSKKELEELLNNRLRELMRSTYTNKSPTINDILPEASKRHKKGLDYIIDRTFLRPRDVIDFFNKCIKNADGKAKINREIIRKAEDEYSHERLRALNDEWLENYGNLHCIYGFLKNSRNSSFKIHEIKSIAEDYFLKIIGNDQILTLNSELQKKFKRFGEDYEIIKLLKPLLILLYEVGLLGIKISGESKNEYIYESYSAYEETDIEDDKTKFYIHPMFHKSLKIKN